jgi:hypothetical protein
MPDTRIVFRCMVVWRRWWSTTVDTPVSSAVAGFGFHSLHAGGQTIILLMECGHGFRHLLHVLLRSLHETSEKIWIHSLLFLLACMDHTLDQNCSDTKMIRTQKLGTQKDLLLIIFLMMISWIQVTLIGLTYLGKQGKEITLQGKEINLLSCHTENRFKGEIAVGGWTGLAPAATSLIGQPPALVKP